MREAKFRRAPGPEAIGPESAPNDKNVPVPSAIDAPVAGGARLQSEASAGAHDHGHGRDPGARACTVRVVFTPPEPFVQSIDAQAVQECVVFAFEPQGTDD